MASFKRRTLVVALALGGLITLNLLLDVFLVWYLGEHSRGNHPLHHAAIGILISQVLLLGFWLGLGDGRWYVRLTLGIALTMSVAKTIGWAAALSPTVRRNVEADPSMMMAFVLIAMLLATSLVAFWLRRLCSWRLTWHEIASVSPTRQFQMGDVLLWMVVIGGALAAVKFLMTIDENFEGQILDLFVITASAAGAVLAALLAGFATHRPARVFVVLISVVFLMGMFAAAPDVYSGIKRAQAAVNGPIAFSVYVSNAIRDGGRHFPFVIGATIGALANCFALRNLGCQLVRPVKTRPIPAAVFGMPTRC